MADRGRVEITTDSSRRLAEQLAGLADHEPGGPVEAHILLHKPGVRA